MAGLKYLCSYDELESKLVQLREAATIATYTTFIKEFLNPLIDGRRREKQFHIGWKKLTDENGQGWLYEGELNNKDQAYGKGKLVEISTEKNESERIRYEGTFYCDKMEGFGTFIEPNLINPDLNKRTEGEFKQSSLFGKCTIYLNDDTIQNETHEMGERRSSKRILTDRFYVFFREKA